MPSPDTRIRTVPAEEVMALALGRRPTPPERPPGVRMVGCRIIGDLYLRDAEVAHGLEFIDCDFAEPIAVDGLAAPWLRISSCRGQSLDAAGLRLDGGLDLSGSSFNDRITLSGARIGGGLLLRGAVVGDSLVGDDIEVTGPLNAAGLRVSGEVLLRGAHIGSTVTFDDARLMGDRGTAISLDRAILNRLTGRRMRAEGQVKLRNAVVEGSVQLAAATLENPGGVAFGAGGLVAHGGLWLNDGFTANGETRLIGARLRANLALDSAVLHHPGGAALTLDRANVGEIDARSAEVVGAKISMVRLTCAGEANFDGAVLSGSFDARQARIEELVLTATLSGPLDLEHAVLGVLRDDPAAWPARLRVHGLVYGALHPQLGAVARLEWLARGQDAFRPQPFEQLAAHYTSYGLPAEARRVLRQKERGRRATLPWFARLWCDVQDVTVGFGYQPWRALAWLAFLTCVGWAVYSSSPPHPLKPAEAPHFNPVAYTLDLLLPLVDLGQQSAFDPVGANQWLSYVLVAVGWVLAGAVAAGAARVVGR